MANIDYLIVGAGGGGGDWSFGSKNTGGGGGAGEVVHEQDVDLEEGDYSVVVGQGGSGDGEDSTFNGKTAKGGGRGGDTGQPGNPGGSGGGGVDAGGGSSTASDGLGNPGGSSPDDEGGGGGGGAGEAGENSVSPGGTVNYNGGDGGDGVEVDITGTPEYYGGGGGGGGSNLRGSGGLGGGGDSNEAGEDGKGGGGGGADGSGTSGRDGGNGVVIVRYRTSDFPLSTGGVKTTDGDYTVHTFSSDGTLTLQGPTAPEVTTDQESNVKPFDATLNGTVDTLGSDIVPEVGFVFGSSSESDPGDVSPGNSSYDSFVKKGVQLTNPASFHGVIKNLNHNQVYYFRAYAKNEIGYSYGDEVSFTTAKAAPVISSVAPAAALLDTTPEITIKGSYFRSGASVDIDGDACTNVTVVDSETITCDVPSSSTVKTGTLTVTNEDNQTDTIDFSYLEDTPAPAQVSPISANVTIQPIGITT